MVAQGDEAMRNLALTLRFDGSAFHGWQAQPNGLAVQEALGHAIERVTGAYANATGCSRTDTGVHAREFVCNFRTESKIPAERFPAALNFYLPEQIAVLACREASEGFHARYDCAGKTYRYHIHNTGLRDPFLLRRATLEPFPLDVALLQKQAGDFIGTHDFAAFCAAGSCVKTTTRTVTRFDVLREGDEVYFYVRAGGFLYHMARIMVGTLLDIAKGRLPEGCVPGILASGDRARAGVTAPAQGLTLWEVYYN
jgi:tRNA pseudouridine38-40 synthase